MSKTAYKFNTTISWQGSSYLEGSTYELTPDLAALFAACVIPSNPVESPKSVKGDGAVNIKDDTKYTSIQAVDVPQVSEPVVISQPATSGNLGPEKEGALSPAQVEEINSKHIQNNRLNMNAIDLTISDIGVLPTIGGVTANKILEIRPENGFDSFSVFKSLCSANNLNRIDWDLVQDLVTFG